MDKRVIKTKRAIREAFIKLLIEKNINNITITDVANYAEVDRKTVYSYYDGIYKILEELENELISQINKTLNDVESNLNIENPQKIFDIINDAINSNLDLYGQLMKMEYNSNFIKKLTNILKEAVEKILNKTQSSKYINTQVVANYITSGFIAVYQEWFNSDRSEPLENISNELGKIVIGGLLSYTK